MTAWLKRPRKPTMRQRDLDLAMTAMHPRVRFIRTLPYGARLLDFGAGDGGLVIYRTVPDPPRRDLRFYAYALDAHPGFAKYDAAEIGRFEDTPPRFNGIAFDAVFASHVIEHLEDHDAFIAWAAGALAADGRLYLEWPSPTTLRLPTRADFLARGIDLMIAHFQDDATHTHLPAMDAVTESLARAGFAIEQQGFVRLPFFEDELLAHDQARANPAYRLAAFWSHTWWAQSVVAVKV